MRVGRWELATVVDAAFRLDGGALFGTVPRARWEQIAPPDPLNRVPLVSRCVVAREEGGGRCVLVDTGVGDRWDETRAAQRGLDRSGGGLLAGLARLGIAPADVTDVVLTHLHSLHAGGTTRRDARGELVLSFPRATHHLQRRHWQWAHAPSAKDAGSFLREDFELLAHSDQLHLVEGEGELFPGLELVVSDGHTVAAQLPRVHGDGVHVTFCGDVIPTRAHLRPDWVSAYDLHPVTTLEEKKVLIAEALEEDGVLVFAHEAGMVACRLREEGGEPAFREAVAL